MPLPREARQEDSLEPGPQDPTPGSDTQVAPSGMTGEPDPAQGIEAISGTPITSNVEGYHHLGKIYQVIHYNSDQNTIEVNLDAETLASPIVEEHNLPSQSSSLILEYANLHTSGLRRSKIIQDKGKTEKGIPKVFGLIALFASVTMSANKYILPETAIIVAKLLHHEERDKYFPENLPNLTNPLASII